MKTINQTFLCIMITLLFTVKATAQTPIDTISGDYLLETNWGGDNFYPNDYIPDNHTAGCHSMAFAQILYFHKIQPKGEVNYTSSKGYNVNENFQNYHPNWELMKITEFEDYDSLCISEVQKYLYYVATTVQKDFGTGSYMKNFHKKELIQHYDCEVKEYFRFKGFFTSNRKIKKILQKEIKAKRPVYFHYTNLNGGGHSVVADGYQIIGGKLFVHFNFGWGGRSNGWYDPLASIANSDDTKLRIITTIEPKNN